MDYIRVIGGYTGVIQGLYRGYTGVIQRLYTGYIGLYTWVIQGRADLEKGSAEQRLAGRRQGQVGVVRGAHGPPSGPPGPPPGPPTGAAGAAAGLASVVRLHAVGTLPVGVVGGVLGVGMVLAWSVDFVGAEMVHRNKILRTSRFQAGQ